MKYILYGHGGSGNHGCEAIVRTTLKMIPSGNTIEVYSSNLEKDKKFGIAKMAKFNSFRSKKDSPIRFMVNKIIYKLFGNADFSNRFALAEALKEKGSICLSVGGDNYCNANIERHVSRNKLFSKNNKTVLWGCSVTPDLMKETRYVEDMKRYSLITARESLTYSAMINAGIKNVKLVSDPAFTLETQEVVLPQLFKEREIIGINISPLIMKYQKGTNTVIKNVKILMDYILNNSEYGIALIPHVLLANNNDLTPLCQLYETFKQTKRVCLIDEDDTLNCCELKFIISKCKFMLAARTHASIAAYSTCVPTLVLGYSVKSQGIATDIFGTANNYVLPVDQIRNDNELKEAFLWLLQNEEQIRATYRTIMPAYIEKAKLAKRYLQDLTK